MEKVRGKKNCVPQDDGQLHKTIINFTWMKLDSADCMWHPIESLIRFTEIDHVRYVTWIARLTITAEGGCAALWRVRHLKMRSYWFCMTYWLQCSFRLLQMQLCWHGIHDVTKTILQLSPWGRIFFFQMLRIPYCVDYRLTDDGKVVSPTRRPHFTPQKHYFKGLVRPDVLGKLTKIQWPLCDSNPRPTGVYHSCWKIRGTLSPPPPPVKQYGSSKTVVLTCLPKHRQ
jgi:hypothetical protein